jgi:hypothetical protein
MSRRVRSYLFMLHLDKSYEQEGEIISVLLHLEKSDEEEDEIVSVYVAPGQE